jgi:fructose-1-phosphate kinase PfkB-like protein
MNSLDAHYSELIEYASQLNIKSFVDCSGDTMRKVLGTKPFMLHINHKEAYELFGTANIDKNITEKIQHCSIAVISHWDKGLFLYDGKMLSMH